MKLLTNILMSVQVIVLPFPVAIALAVSEVRPATAADPTPILSAVEVIAKHKSLIESKAHTFKRRCVPGDVKYREGEDRYAQTKAAFDSWVEILKVALDLEVDFNDVPQFGSTLNNAVTKAVAFSEFVDSIGERCSGISSINLPATIALIAKDLTEAAVELRKQYVKEKNEGKDRIKKDLDNLKLKPFEET